ncbi:MAG: preprotein translocase subunit SecG [Clostridium sp.]
MAKTALEIIIVISAILVIISISLQESKASGLGGLVSGTSETFYSKNKTKTKEAFLMKLTIVSATVFAVATILINRILM